MTRNSRQIEVRPVSGALGAEIHGVDISEPLDEDSYATIRQAFLDHMVIFFRDQHLTPDQHVAFARRFGTLRSHPYVPGMADHPEVIEIIKQAKETINWGTGWHSDLSFEEEPPLGAILYAKDVPSYCGDTLFSNMNLAYETLSDGMKQTLRGLIGVHVGDNSSYRTYEAVPMTLSDPGSDLQILKAEHPLVRTHAETGRKSLYLNRWWLKHFKGWTVEESQPIIDFLNRHAQRPEFTCRFRWEVNSIAFWDNRCTLHLANDDYFYSIRGFEPARRHMHRVSIAGERPM